MEIMNVYGQKLGFADVTEVLLLIARQMLHDDMSSQTSHCANS
jgi:hypothetical protein